MSSPTLVLALDFGVKKMGMALGNSLTADARPFDILAMNNGQPDWENLLGIIDTWKIDVVLVGLPLNIDGTDSMISKRAHKFARRLAHRLGERKNKAQVFLYDERLSSAQARSVAWERGWIDDERTPIDDIAACLLIDGYFYAPEVAQRVGSYHDGEHDD
ncbi:Holliday junction resolvase RuvX [Moraxella caviae]|uniref:Putative pre-16S rRNA nuclease n=1 Tax=Moraxella caviae TaxID=34060 RepID=A0A1S9ZW72_9GAMM|nr:Holliday junction resolvase RuvX [Moraxella caviae]OOR87782.1 Holliday junction resolvase RuvX [Moraxella caviae]STZ10536.1 Putative Holliday junction resolvase [Moraxella caviae]VEW11337.1 Putative Holliday junction resolvase [Moraxella caviae]